MFDQTASSSGERAGKRLFVQEYKRRLRDSLKSLNDNFIAILHAAKIAGDDTTSKQSSAQVGSGKMAEYSTMRNEMCVRAALMVKATDELLALTHDIRELLLVRDFNFLSSSILSAEKRLQTELLSRQQEHDRLRQQINFAMITDIDRELLEHFSLRQ